MRFLLVAFLLLPLSGFAGHGKHGKQEVEAPKGPKDYGKGIELKSTPLSLADAAKSLDKEKEVVIQAKIGTVCQVSGCWITLEDGKTSARVTYNHGFFLPKKAGSRMALVQGKIYEKEVSAAEARHYAEDSGLPESEVKKITQPQKALWVQATGIRIL